MVQFSRLFCGTLLFALHQPVEAQLIHGSLLEEGTEIPIAAALVILVDSTGVSRHQVMTDTLGAFRIPAAPGGTYRLAVERLGYEPVRSDPIVVSRSDTVGVQLYLSPRALRLEPLIVSGRTGSRLDKFYENRSRFEKLGIGDFFGRSDLEPWTNHSISAVLQSVPYLNSSSQTMARMRRGRRCEIAYYVDGVRLRSLFGQSIDAVLRVVDLEGIEVYRGLASLPAEYSDAQSRGCPVVALWTRRGK